MNIAVIQARMASRRLPGKALMLLGSYPLIYYVISRTKKIQGIDKIILATSHRKENDPLATYADSLGIEVFRGDEDNVLERFHLVAQATGAKNIIRVTGDNPLIDFNSMSLLLKYHCDNRNDYTCAAGFPVGSIGDIFSRQALEESYLHANGKELNDHVDLYILENQNKFKIMLYQLKPDLSTYRWTIDSQSDLDIMKAFLNTASESIIALGMNQLIDKAVQARFSETMTSRKVEVSKENMHSAQLAKKIVNKCDIQKHALACWDSKNEQVVFNNERG
ncbi:MAG: hypothetical protein KKH94_12700 [Candidatus Omnitrophica bacterium]|nr:hypothetical protein [Candidatus Omnitrophota bacterium]